MIAWMMLMIPFIVQYAAPLIRAAMVYVVIIRIAGSLRNNITIQVCSVIMYRVDMDSIMLYGCTQACRYSYTLGSSHWFLFLLLILLSFRV